MKSPIVRQVVPDFSSQDRNVAATSLSSFTVAQSHESGEAQVPESMCRAVSVSLSIPKDAPIVVAERGAPLAS